MVGFAIVPCVLSSVLLLLSLGSVATGELEFGNKSSGFVFGNVGLTVVAVVFSVLSLLLPLGCSVVRLVATGGRVETGSDEPS